MATLFDVLGISPTSDERAIKKAYKAKALQHHPDKGGDPAAFRNVNEAYDILIDEEQREKYVQLVKSGTTLTDLEQFVAQQEALAKENNISRPSSKYERTCRTWIRGKCNNKNCMYRHYKTASADRARVNKLCHDYTKGYCRFGNECQFKHPGNLEDESSLSNRITNWICNDIWQSCNTENDILSHPRRCKSCGAKRKLNRCKFPLGTSVQIIAPHPTVVEDTLSRILFFSRDGVYRRPMLKLLQTMKSTPFHSHMMPVVRKFYPSAGCYHCVFGDGTFMIVSEKNLKKGIDQWVCSQCKHNNNHIRNHCTLCDLPNPNPIQDWDSFLGTWKSSSGNYYINIDEHIVTSSEPTHYYTNIKLSDETLSYDVTILEEDEDDIDSSDDESDNAMPEKVGTAYLKADPPTKLSGDFILVSGGSTSSNFEKVTANIRGSGTESSSTFDSEECTEDRENRLSEKRSDPIAYREKKLKLRKSRGDLPTNTTKLARDDLKNKSISPDRPVRSSKEKRRKKSVSSDRPTRRSSQRENKRKSIKDYSTSPDRPVRRPSRRERSSSSDRIPRRSSYRRDDRRDDRRDNFRGRDYDRDRRREQERSRSDRDRGYRRDRDRYGR